MVKDGTAAVSSRKAFEKARRYSLMPNAMLLKNSSMSRRTQRFHGVAQVKVGLSIAFALERENRVEAALDLAVGHAREVHAEEREVGLGTG